MSSIKYISIRLFFLSSFCFSFLETKGYNESEFTNIKNEIRNEITNKESIRNIIDTLNKDKLEKKALLNILLGDIHYKEKKYIDCSKNYEVAIPILNQLNYKLNESICLMYLGNSYLKLKRIDEGLINLSASISIFKNLNDIDNLIKATITIANHHSKYKNLTLAEKSYSNIIDYLDQTSNKKLKIFAFFNYANLLSERKKYDLAQKYFFECLQYAEESADKGFKANIYNNIGVIYLRTHQDYNKAKYYINRALQIRYKTEDTLNIILAQQNLFRIAITTENINEASVIYEEINRLSDLYSIDLKDKVNYSYNKISYYALIKNSGKLRKELGIYGSLKDSLSNIAFSDKLVEMQKSFEIKERDKNIALLQKEDELKEARLNNQFIVIVSISVVVLVLIVLGYFINRQRIKLKKSECDLKKQQDRIQAMNDNLDLSNQAKDRILSIIGHDLRGPIGGLKELIDLYVDLPTYEEEDFKSLIKAAREASTGSYHLLENLLTWANSQRGQINFMPVNAPLYPLVKQCVDLLDSSINTRHVGFKFDIHPNLKLTADLNMIRTVVRNLVSNAVKYSPPESCVTISAVQNNVETLISITDSGYGMSADQAEVLFTQKETYYIEAGYNAKGTGLGLILCREFVERHNGRIWADSKTNKGTQVCFTIPLNIEEVKIAPIHENSAVLN
nr:tetratricopeptide repeat-containing sensor histidine kinase [uncultured Carboxylicivirga sp.]